MQTTVGKLQKVLADYGDETESKKNHYNYLKMRDEANTASIEENNKRICEYSVRQAIDADYYRVGTYTIDNFKRHSIHIRRKKSKC